MTTFCFIGRMLLVPVRIALLPLTLVLNIPVLLDKGTHVNESDDLHGGRWFSTLDFVWWLGVSAITTQWEIADKTADRFEHAAPSDDTLLRPCGNEPQEDPH